MAEQWGGKRTPRNPAPVSGPGQLSQRTDGGPQQVQAEMTGMPYGENQEFATLQSAAPMSASRSAGSPRARQREAAQGASATPLFAPTQRPDEPVTAGAPFGPGDGPANESNPGMNAINRADAEMLGKYLPDLMRSAASPSAPDGFIRFVRHLRNIQGAQ
jgi:hypothetical protein